MNLLAFLLLALPLGMAGTPDNNEMKDNDMKELSVKKISVATPAAEAVPALLDSEQVSFQSIGNVNWPDDYPYHPQAEFRIAHTDDAILLHYRVTEASVAAVAGCDNGPVWEDACVEFFSMPAGDDIYYNVECNCAGTLLIGAGSSRDGRQPAPQEVLDRVSRWSSLGRDAFEERIGECSWQVALVIPYTAFFLHDLHSLDGREVRANFYKCGDKLQTPHFLSWNPIHLPSPNFHVPQFFGLLKME